MRASLVVLALACACPSIPIPDPHLPSAEDLGRQPTGSWIAVTAGPITVGELVAIDRGAFYVKPEGADIVAIPVSQVTDARLVAWHGSPGKIDAWGLAGTASTASHGAFLILTAPVWLITTISSDIAHRHEPIFDYPDRPLDEIRRYARFPQGLPPGFP